MTTRTLPEYEGNAFIEALGPATEFEALDGVDVVVA